MKGTYYCRLRGRHLTVCLICVTFMTILTLAREKKPFGITMWQTQEQLNIHSPDEHKYNSTTPKEIQQQEKLNQTPSSYVWKESSPLQPSSLGVYVDEQSHKPKEIEKLAPDKHNQEDCNYAKGRWVADGARPLYSGFWCKQWLSEMWACRLTQRTDFSYEGYRWQPDKCEMPMFERSSFLKKMQDKTIAFVGDSLGRQQFQSLMCMATGGKWVDEVEDAGKKFGLVKRAGAVRPDGWAYRFSSTNTTILYYWSASLADLQPLSSESSPQDVAMHLDRAPAFLRRFLDWFDVLILNTGHHWNRGKFRANHWVMYANGEPVKDRKLSEIGNAKNFTVRSVVRWLDSQLRSRPAAKAFFRTMSPRHFRNGDWNTGGNCDNTFPLTRGSEVAQNESSDSVIAAAIRGTRVKLLDITALSELRDEAHVSRYSVKASPGVNDCLHWCLPGIPDVWNELLFAQA